MLFEGKVCSEWLAQGIWLREAAAKFADARSASDLATHASRFAELRDGESPEVFRCTIPTRGLEGDREGAARLYGDAQRAFRLWCAAKQIQVINLMARLNFGSLAGFGAKGAADGEVMWIPGQAWFYLTFCMDEGNVVRGEGMAYWHVRICTLSAVPQVDEPVKRGRRPGRNYQAQDKPLVAEMMKMIADGKTRWEAADAVAARAEGKHTSVASKTKRLLLRLPPE